MRLRGLRGIRGLGGGYTPGGVYPLEACTDVVQAFGTVALAAAYEDATILTAENSLGTTDTFSPAEWLAGTSLETLASAGDGTLRPVSLVDQSGNANSCTRAYASAPNIVSAGSLILQNSVPTIDHYAGSSLTMTGLTLTGTGAWTLYVVCEYVGSQFDYVVGQTANNKGVVLLSSSGVKLDKAVDVTLGLPAGGNTTGLKVAAVRSNGYAIAGFVNGVEGASSPVVDATTDLTSVVAWGRANAQYYEKNSPALIYCSGAHTDAQVADVSGLLMERYVIF